MAVESSNPDTILNILHQSAKKGTLLASCEPEVKELMHQIDVLLSTRTESSHSQSNMLKQQLQLRDKELASLRLAIKEKTIQNEKLREDLIRCQHQLKVKTSDHETQLLRQRSELNRLSKCYEKLKNRKSRSGDIERCRSLETDNKVLKETIEVLQEKYEYNQRQLEHHKLSVKELASTNESLTATLVSSQRELASLQEELKLCQNVQYKRESEELLAAKDKKISLLKKERDMARAQTGASLTESDKWQTQAMTLSKQNKELESHVNDIARQLIEMNQSIEVIKEHHSQEIAKLKQIIDEKEAIIKSLNEQNSEVLSAKDSSHQKELQTVQATLEMISVDKKKLKEENYKLKKKLENKTGKTSQTSSPIQVELDKRETELHECKLQLLKKDTLLDSYQEQVTHLEELLSEATLQANSSHDCSTTNQSHDPPTLTPPTASLVAEFQDKLGTILNSHFSRIDQSLKEAALTEN